VKSNDGAPIPATQRPLYEIKANLFKALAHPMRIRVLEILSLERDSATPVRDLLDLTGLEASHLSQHLSVLKRHHVVSATRTGNAVYYRLTDPAIADLLVTARRFLTSTLGEQQTRYGLIESLPPLSRSTNGNSVDSADDADDTDDADADDAVSDAR